MPSRKITMDDIASMAGVTKSTVSRYFNGGSVKESTRERIQEIIREYNYEPNTFARLKAKESNVIGVVLPTLNSKVSSRVVTSIGRYLREQGYETLIKDSDHSVDLELKNMQRLITLKADGIILSAITITEDHRKLIRESPVPVVVVAQDYSDGISIVHDDYGAGRAMGSRIGRSRPRRVGYMGVDSLDVAVGVNRKQGVMDGLKEWGVEDIIVATGDYSYVSGITMAEEILNQGPVDAIVCATDRLAFGAYYVLGRRGLSVPEDVAVAGFGGYDESALLKPELATLRFDSYGLGYLGAETVLKMIREEPVPKKQIVDYIMIDGGSLKE